MYLTGGMYYFDHDYILHFYGFIVINSLDH
jgi:hypothetical protein